MSVLTAFASHCRTNAYALWAGTWDYYAFMDAMIPEIENGYQSAWREALAAHGMEPEDATEEEERYVADAQAQASSHLNDLAEWIELHARDGEEPLLLAAIHGRIDLWVNDLQRLITWANTELAGNEKLRWDYGATEAHCEDCAKYVGRVYRARAWARVGALPQARELACGGWRCDCRLTPTTERANKGFPPRPSGRMHELAEWDDASHPRDENGRFASGGGGGNAEIDSLAASLGWSQETSDKLGRAIDVMGQYQDGVDALDRKRNEIISNRDRAKADMLQGRGLSDITSEEYDNYEKLERECSRELMKVKLEEENLAAKVNEGIIHEIEAPEAGKLDVTSNMGPRKMRDIKEGAHFVERLAGEGASNFHSVEVSDIDSRGSYNQSKTGEHRIDVGGIRDIRASTFVHELGHGAMCEVPEADQLCREFLDRRTKDEPLRKLRTLEGKGYGAEEVCKPDKFFSPYCGKIYKEGNEIFSMAIEQLYRDPKVLLQDKEYAGVVLEALQRIRKFRRT